MIEAVRGTVRFSWISLFTELKVMGLPRHHAGVRMSYDTASDEEGTTSCGLDGNCLGSAPVGLFTTECRRGPGRITTQPFSCTVAFVVVTWM